MDFIFQKEEKNPETEAHSTWDRFCTKDNPSILMPSKETINTINIIHPSKKLLEKTKNPQISENQQYCQQIWSYNYFFSQNNIPKNPPPQEFLTPKSSSFISNSRKNQINISQNSPKSEIFNYNGVELEAYFKDLFPINFQHQQFPIFSLFIQRIPQHDVFEEVWYYKDPQGEIQGPFTSNDMDSWNNDGYFSSKLLIAWSQHYDFVTIENFIKSPSQIINLSLKHINISKYFRNAIINPINPENIYGQKKSDEKTMMFNSHTTSLINNSSNRKTEIVDKIDKISTESLKVILGITGNENRKTIESNK